MRSKRFRSGAPAPGEISGSVRRGATAPGGATIVVSAECRGEDMPAVGAKMIAAVKRMFENGDGETERRGKNPAGVSGDNRIK